MILLLFNALQLPLNLPQLFQQCSDIGLCVSLTLRPILGHLDNVVLSEGSALGEVVFVH